MTLTTQELIEKKSRLKDYKTLEIKRRFVEGYEATWFDISRYVLSVGNIKTAARLDFDSFGYGEFKTFNLEFTLNNNCGQFGPETQLYSFFENTESRHYTKVRFTAGYYDGDTRINEQVFEGLLNEKEIKTNFMDGTITFTVLSYNQILKENYTASGALTSYNYMQDMVGQIMNSTRISQYINYSALNINPGVNIYIDSPSYYENKPIADVFNELCKKSNSAWYIDSSNNLIIRDRNINDKTAFNFVGGYGQKYQTNILKIELFDEGFGKMINGVIYKTGNSAYKHTASNEFINRYGENNLIFESDDITNANTIETLSAAIINEWKAPRRRIILTTVYMPNIISFFDPCIISFTPKKRSYNGLTTLIFNGGGQWNNSEYYTLYDSFSIIKNDRYYVYYGYEHDISNNMSRHFLIEYAYIGQGLAQFVWNSGNWNNGEFFN